MLILWYNKGMSADIANWLQVNIINNPQVFKSLIALIIMILAGFLSFGKPKKSIFVKRFVGVALFVFGMFLFLYANIDNLAGVFTVWATLILAGVAVFSFEESRRLRRENRQIEGRRSKESSLIEIIKWAEDIDTVSLASDSTIAQLLRYGNSMSRATSIGFIIELRFRDELLHNFSEVCEVTFNIMCIRHYMEKGRLPDEKGFPKDIIERTKERLLKEGLQDVFDDYAADSHHSIIDLLENSKQNED